MSARGCVLGLCFALACAPLQAQDVASPALTRAAARSGKVRPVKKTTASGKRQRKGKGGAVAADAEPSLVAPTRSEPQLDPRLAEQLATKIRECYRVEAGRELSDEDAKLLEEYKLALVDELESGLPDPGCKARGVAGEDCLRALGASSCAQLSSAIVRKRWDRHLLASDRRALSRYTTALAERKAHCRSQRGVDSDIVEQQVEASRLDVVASMSITTGRCQLDLEGRPGCEEKLAKLACPEIESAIAKEQFVYLCDGFLRCHEQ